MRSVPVAGVLFRMVQAGFCLVCPDRCMPCHSHYTAGVPWCSCMAGSSSLVRDVKCRPNARYQLPTLNMQW